MPELVEVRVTGGTTATGVATVVDGVVTSVKITNSGSSYTTAPTITFGPPPTGGTQATGTATIVDGVVTAIVVVGGSGYTSAPTVTFSDAPQGNGNDSMARELLDLAAATFLN
jgi:hypothetical protein